MDDDILNKIQHHPDFIVLKRYQYSLTVLRSKYKDEPIPPKLIAAALSLTEEELQTQYEKITEKLRALMIPSAGDDIT